MRRAVSIRAAVYVVLADRKPKRRSMAGLAHESLPGLAVRALRSPNEAESGEVRELVTEHRVEQRRVFCDGGCECNATRIGVGPTERPGEAVGEPDRDRGCEVRHRPEPGKLADAMVEATGVRCLR